MKIFLKGALILVTGLNLGAAAFAADHAAQDQPRNDEKFFMMVDGRDSAPCNPNQDREYYITFQDGEGPNHPCWGNAVYNQR